MPLSRFAPVGLLLLLAGSFLLFVGCLLLLMSQATLQISLVVIFITLVGVVAVAVGRHVLVVDAAAYSARDVAASPFTIGLTLSLAAVLFCAGAWLGRLQLLAFGVGLALVVVLVAAVSRSSRIASRRTRVAGRR